MVYDQYINTRSGIKGNQLWFTQNMRTTTVAYSKNACKSEKVIFTFYVQAERKNNQTKQ